MIGVEWLLLLLIAPLCAFVGGFVGALIFGAATVSTGPVWDDLSATHLLLAATAAPHLTPDQLDTVMPDLRELAEHITAAPGTDDEPYGVHPLSCNVWRSDEPCNCGSDQWNAGVEALMATFERRIPRRQAS